MDTRPKLTYEIPILSANDVIFDCRTTRRGSLKIPFAFHIARGRYVDATEVDSGENCGCICPGCKESVTAKRKRKRNVDHFSHREGAVCAGAFETSVHQAAKQVMAELDEIALPACERGPLPLFRFFATQAEYDLKSIKPDVLARSPEEDRLAIEIRVTHEVDEVKRAKIEELSIDCIEYDLSKISRLLTYKDLISLFRSNEVPSHWIHNCGVKRWIETEMRVLRDREEEEARRAEEAHAEELIRLKKIQAAEDAARTEQEKVLTEKRRADWEALMPWARD